MKPLNLLSLLNAKKGLSAGMLGKLLGIWELSAKEGEFTTLEKLIDEFKKLGHFKEDVYDSLSCCYFGFTIPQISKEFDCLWISKDSIVNLEFKRDPIDEERIRKQLIQNKHYLRPLKRSIVLYTFVASSREFFILQDDNTLSKGDANSLFNELMKIHEGELYEENLEFLFPPQNYLVSPFNSTDAFLNKEYFLTGQQEEFKKKILSDINTTTGASIYAISGGPGSGKTLLLYDIAQSLLSQGLTVAIGHSGSINTGQNSLIEKGWDIRPTKKLFNIVFDSLNNAKHVPVNPPDVYLIDEAQRSPHVGWVIEDVKKNGRKCVFSYDPNQCLNKEEIGYDNAAKILAETGAHSYKLTANIRSNRDVYDFVMSLFNIRHPINRSVKNSIELSYCSNSGEVLNILESLKKRGFVVPKFTPSASSYYSKNDYEEWFPSPSPSAHEVIGQEFDCVAGLISPNMQYDPSGKLVSAKDYYYIEDRMLFQILSRARKKIHLVVYNNPTMLDRCISIINQK